MKIGDVDPNELKRFIFWLELTKGLNIPDLLLEYVRWKENTPGPDPKKDN